ncbi:protocatechuate 3,4-dioxygenase alpha subunit [Aminobacter lissarensis]|uniref:Protocatechuate 3,4-dioxygenase alpha subunit n=1 Tax=Aminobacter carboxidus TaxID=376165 RepID=A0A8E1WIK3_9HYPH|nr:protocatechuate 3,4-dioxygenase subunit alpha [Aminobacter lissarensis]MBB6469098.1 protocatechuate 3,4-dioxygenase alpha subunit [Aminobacter lissarensis]
MPTDEQHIITPSQTVGPFYAYCLTPFEYDFPPLASGILATDDAVGARVIIKGRLLDGDGAPVPDGMIEVWQPDGEGRFAGQHPALKNSKFTGFGRTACDEQGWFTIETVKPGRVPLTNGELQAPHIAVSIFGKGLNRQLYTRIYFEDESSNLEDPVMALVPNDLRTRLIAKACFAGGYQITFKLQGEDESVFFAV